MFFACGPIVGPVFEYSDFKNFCELKGHYKTLPVGSFVTLWPAIKELLGGYLCLGIHIAMVLGGGFDIYFCGSKEFMTYKSIWFRIGYYFMSMTSQRFMYYTPW